MLPEEHIQQDLCSYVQRKRGCRSNWFMWLCSLVSPRLYPSREVLMGGRRSGPGPGRALMSIDRDCSSSKTESGYVHPVPFCSWTTPAHTAEVGDTSPSLVYTSFFWKCLHTYQRPCLSCSLVYPLAQACWPLIETHLRS